MARKQITTFSAAVQAALPKTKPDAPATPDTADDTTEEQ